ncbi:MAG: SprB repeat-containing protein [Chitinophagaceae bacterium]
MKYLTNTKWAGIAVVMLAITQFISIPSLAQCNFTVTATATHVNCYNGTTGTITVNVAGGTGPFSYQLAEAGAGAWQSGNQFTALTANTYPVSVRDASGCIKTIYVTVTQPDALLATYTALHGSCSGANNGSVTIHTTGGATPYSYSWTRNGSPYATSANLSNLSPGNYLLTVTDANGCSTSPVITSEMKPVSLTGFNTDVIANGNGAADASTTGAIDNSSGNAFYASGYSNGSTTGSNGLPASGVFNSVQDNSREYHLASYAGNNTLQLRSSSNPDLSTGSTSGTLTFGTQNKSLYSSLYVVGTTGNGTGVVNYTVHFTDGGSTYTGSLNFPDWYLTPATASANRALGDLDRVARTSGASAFTGSTDFNLFEAPITIPVGSQGRVVDRIDFDWGSADNARINLFAVTGYTSTAYGIRINDGPASNVTPAASLQLDAPGNQFCAGQTVIFSASSLNAGSNPTYQWYRNSSPVSGATAATFSTNTLANNDIIGVQITAGGSGTGCLAATTATASVTMIQATRTAGVSIATASNTVCNGSTISFTATPVNGGASPLYQWRINGNNAGAPTSSATYSSSSLNSGDIVSTILTSSIGCATNNPATSNTITMTVLPVGEPTVEISSTPAINFTSTSSFGGSTPAYQWYRNGVIIPGAQSATYSTSAAVIGEQYSLKMISSYLCRTAPAAMSNYVQVTYITLPVKLESFTAQQSGTIIQLKWKTSYEENLRQFIVQRSATGSPTAFETIGTVGASRQANGSNYSFDDETAGAGRIFYRLIMEDIDGKQEISPIRSVQVTQPALRVADIGHSWQIQNNTLLQYALTDLQGHVLQSGSSSSILTLKKPAVKGIYLLRIIINENISFFKVSSY